MTILDNTSKTTQIVLGEVIATAQPQYTASYEDINVAGGTFVAGATNGVLNGTTPVTVVGSPGASTQRRIKEISVYNADSVAHTVIAQYYDGTNTEIMVKKSLSPGATLWYGGGQWQILFANVPVALLIANNLSDVNNVTTSRSNLYAAPFDALAYNGMQVNGSMDVSQVNGASQITIGNNTFAYIVDQIGAGYYQAAATAVFKAQQAAAAGPPGYQNYILLTATTAFSPAAGDIAYFQIPIEGYRVARLGFGAAGAQPVSIGFWVISTVSGTASVSILNSALNRSYVANITLNAAAWQFVTVTIPGDVAGTWLTTNGVGLRVYLCFGAGSNFQAAPNTWNTGAYYATASTTNFFASNNNGVFITGLVVLPGIELPSAARSPLIMRPYTDELPLCQRYLAVLLAGSVYNAFGAGFAYTSSGGQFFLPYPVLMRAAPTITQSNTCIYGGGGGIQAVTGFAGNYIGTESALMAITVAGTPLTTGVAALWIANANAAAYIELNAQM